MRRCGGAGWIGPTWHNGGRSQQRLSQASIRLRAQCGQMHICADAGDTMAASTMAASIGLIILQIRIVILFI
jgi:hypothetical protein